MQRAITPPPRTALVNEALTPAFLAGGLLQLNPLKQPPRGRGETVLVWPGFGAGNGSTTILRQYLRLIGYHVEGWQQGRNSADVQATLDALKDDVAARGDGEPVTLVGWSLGGYLAREVARDCPELVRHVVTLGSPVVGGPKYTSVAGAFTGQSPSIDEIERIVDERYEVPLEVPVTALYSKFDGVVAWQACIDERSPNVEHVEVTTSHLGFGFDARVFQLIAERIARHQREA